MVSLFPENPVPLLTSFDNAESTYTFGEDILFSEAGTIDGVRFWGSSNPITTSPSGAVFLTSGGAPVSSQAYAGYPAGFQVSAWNTVMLSSPVTLLTPGLTRRVSVGPLNRYAAGTGVFPRTANGMTGSAGYFVAAGTLTFPDSAPQTTWYAVDVLFTPAAGTYAGKTIIVRPARGRSILGRSSPIVLRTSPITAARPPLSWSFEVAPNKWRLGMDETRISALSLERVRTSVFVTSNGTIYNPTHAAIAYAFLEDNRARPEAGDWKPGTWDVTLTRTYMAECLVGPSGTVQLARGRYYRWLRITDPVSAETVIAQVGKLFVD